MSVGKAGGRGGGAGRAGGQGASKGGGQGKVDRSQGLVGPSGAAGSSNVGGASASAGPDPVVAQAMEIVRQLKAGELKSRHEATKKLVQDILKRKVRMQSQALTQRIADEIEGDPRLSQALDRLWGSEDSEGKGKQQQEEGNAQEEEKATADKKEEK